MHASNVIQIVISILSLAYVRGHRKVYLVKINVCVRAFFN